MLLHTFRIPGEGVVGMYIIVGVVGLSHMNMQLRSGWCPAGLYFTIIQGLINLRS